MTSISVVMPVKDGERYLAAALDSIRAQQHPALEIVVVDDGSTDDSAAIARRAADQVLSQPHSGLGAAMANGVAAASGELLAFLDADDLWPDGRLDTMLAALDADPSLGAVLGQVDQFFSPDLAPELRDRLQVVSMTVPGFVQGAMVIRRDAFDTVGSFDSTLTAAPILDWWQRAEDVGLVYEMLDEVVLRRRIHASNHTHQLGGELRSAYVRMLKQGLDRRRAHGG